MPTLRRILIWGVFAGAIVSPIGIAATSPYLAYREPIYILSGFAGIIALCLSLAQPLLAGGYLPGVPAVKGRRIHRWTGFALFMAVVLHVVGLWITSPPDVVDALLFSSPTPFSLWGVIAMWAVFVAAALAAFRKRWRISPRVWRLAHTGLAVLIVGGGVAHAMLIEGTMGATSKIILSALVIAATAKVIFDLRSWALLFRPRR